MATVSDIIFVSEYIWHKMLGSCIAGYCSLLALLYMDISGIYRMWEIFEGRTFMFVETPSKTFAALVYSVCYPYLLQYVCASPIILTLYIICYSVCKPITLSIGYLEFAIKQHN